MRHLHKGTLSIRKYPRQSSRGTKYRGSPEGFCRLRRAFGLAGLPRCARNDGVTLSSRDSFGRLRTDQGPWRSRLCRIASWRRFDPLPQPPPARGRGLVVLSAAPGVGLAGWPSLETSAFGLVLPRPVTLALATKGTPRNDGGDDLLGVEAVGDGLHGIAHSIPLRLSLVLANSIDWWSLACRTSREGSSVR